MGEEEQLLQQSPPSDGAVGEVGEVAEQSSYSWPVMNFDVPPYRSHHFHRQFCDSSNPNNFLKGLKWSPDGCYFLTTTEDNTLRLFPIEIKDLPYGSSAFHAYCSGILADALLGLESDSYMQTGAVEDSYASSLVITEGESIYDYCWYPYMNSSDVTSCVFATTTRDHPIHLWDSTTGELRCTYRAYDAMDEITAAYSIAFNPSGTKIFAGYNKNLRVFDVHRPGRDFSQHSTLLKGKKEGQSGIVSSIAFTPDHSGMLATGCYDQTTAIYREDNMELLYVLHGQEGGVTQVQFSKDGNYLYTGARKDPYILCWDLRNTVEIVYKLYRSTESTNQKISFDVEPLGQHLGTGGQDGLVHFYDLKTGHWKSSFQAASDTVNGFAFHPYLPMAASSSGHRRYGVPDDQDEDFTLSGNENCVSVWSFAYTTATEADSDLNAHEAASEDSEPKNDA